LATNPDLTEAQKLVAAMLDPSKAVIEANRQAALAEAAAQAQGIQGFSQAAAQQVAPIGGQVQDGYQEAAGRTQQYSKGYSIGMQMALGNSANETNAFLAKNGSPLGQQIGPGVANAAADVLYGTTGAIPAGGLEREGAAFGAAASLLPATMLGRGQQLQAESQRAAQKTDKEFLADIAELEAQRPGAIQKAVLELRDLRNKERGQRLDEQIAIEKLGISKANLGLAGQRVQIAGANAATSRMNAQTQRYNSSLRKLQNDRSYQATLKRLGLQEAGLSLRATQLEAKKKSGGFSKTKLFELKGLALDTARAAIDGGYKDGDTWVPVNKRPQEVLRDLLDKDIPFSVAIAAIQAMGRRAGPNNPAWRATLKWTKRKK
jgi:hypothetical protein